jgi:hypothetical protein
MNLLTVEGSCSSLIVECTVDRDADVTGGLLGSEASSGQRADRVLFGDGPGDDHPGDSVGGAVEGDAAAAFGSILDSAQVRREQGGR